MASGPITSWQMDGGTMETVTDFIFLGSEVTEEVDCSHESKRHLLLVKKAMTNLDCIFKSRDIILPTKVRILKAMVLPIVMYQCEWCTIKKAEHETIDASELWCWRRLLRFPWTARWSNQAITPDAKHSLTGKDPDAGKDWGQEAKGSTEDKMVGWHHQLNGHEFEQTLGDNEAQGSLVCYSPWGCKDLDMTGWLNNNLPL